MKFHKTLTNPQISTGTLYRFYFHSFYKLAHSLLTANGAITVCYPSKSNPEACCKTAQVA